MKIRRLSISLALCASVFATPFLSARDANTSLQLEIENAVSKGVTWLQKAQAPEGHWGDPKIPALTALSIMAQLGNPSETGKAPNQSVRMGLKYIKTLGKPDGGIYGKGLASYNTAICVRALSMVKGSEFDQMIANGRRFLINQQPDYDARGEADNQFDGGVGYGSSYGHPDLSNTYMALEALYFSRHKVEVESEKRKLDFKAAISFIERCQNRPESNDQEWASDDPKNKGGFIYFPGKSMAGKDELPNGKVALRSYGSMTYAGILSYIYAGMEPSDPRIQDAVSWLKGNYTLEENPGMGLQGLFYYYHTMAKALTIAGIDTLEVDGKQINWRVELTKTLLNMQSADGSWANTNGRWWEKDPMLVTPYACMILSYIHADLGRAEG